MIVYTYLGDNDAIYILLIMMVKRYFGDNYLCVLMVLFIYLGDNDGVHSP